MNAPNRQLHEARMRAIKKAKNAIQDARDIGVYSLEFARAIENLRIAEAETKVDYQRRLDAWAEEHQEA